MLEVFYFYLFIYIYTHSRLSMAFARARAQHSVQKLLLTAYAKSNIMHLYFGYNFKFEYINYIYSVV